MSGENETIVDPAGATSRLTAAARARETLRDDRLFEDAFASDLANLKSSGTRTACSTP
jgi:O-methyltransferase involved in polyketide biosynthesis